LHISHISYFYLYDRTLPLSNDRNDDDDDDDDDGVVVGKINGNQTSNSNKKKLCDYLPNPIREQLFGSIDYTVASAAQYRYAIKRVPYIYIYIISTNPEHVSTLTTLFQGIPCIMYRLSSTDFLETSPPKAISSISDVNQEKEKSSPVTIYAGIGVDRVANVVGARSMFPTAKNILVIDGGTAMTYTTTLYEPNIDEEQSYVLKMGGGIGPGLQMRFRSLFDYATDIPFVESPMVAELLTECKTLKKPLSLFTSSSVNTNDNISEEDNEKLMCKSIVACVMTETAHILCSIIRKWLSMSRNQIQNGNNAPQQIDQQNMPMVVLTGGDIETYGSLLRRHHSYICETNDANIELLNHGITEDDNSWTQKGAADMSITSNSFRVKCEKCLQSHAVAHILLSYITTYGNDIDIDEEIIRNQLLGIRIAIQKTDRNNKNRTQEIGTIVASQRGLHLDEDVYLIIHDGDDTVNSMTTLEIYSTSTLF
jgi:pantothenate kinase type III